MQRQLRAAFNGEATLVHDGENTVWRVDVADAPRAVRVYRPGRRTLREIEAEWAWARALGEHVPTPQPLGAPRRVAGAWAVAMTWVEGRHLDLTVPADVSLLGEAAGAVFRAARVIEAVAPADWPGRQRPLAEPASRLDRAEAIACGAAFVTSSQRARLEGLLRDLRSALPGGPTGWVHGDLHAGNVLRAGPGFVVLDLDDAVVGPVTLEWATPRTHLRARTDLGETWPRFLDAVGVPLDDDEVRRATALHLVDTIAEFPSHLDLAVLSDPTAVVERYLGFLAAELG